MFRITQISLRHFLLLTLLVGAALGIAGSYWRASVYQRMPITGTWSGKVPSEAMIQASLAQPLDTPGGNSFALSWIEGEPRKYNDPLNAPAIGLVCDAETWDAVWKAWHGGDAPKVDFQREFVIAVKGEGPNQMSCWDEPTRNGKGDAKVVIGQTLIGGPGFCYFFLKTPRPEIQSINGKPVPRIDLKLKK